MALTHDSDGALWRWSKSDFFSVKSAFIFLQDGGIRDSRFSKVWSTRAPLKVKIFIWLILRGRVLTTDNLRKRGWAGDDCCTLCSSESESVDHLFIGCPTTKVFLQSLLSHIPLIRNCSSASMLWEVCCLSGGAAGGSALASIAASWWALWLERNLMVFELKKRSLNLVLADARYLRSLWGRCCI